MAADFYDRIFLKWRLFFSKIPADGIFQIIVSCGVCAFSLHYLIFVRCLPELRQADIAVRAGAAEWAEDETSG